MENSSPNPSFSICDIRIQKQISRSFGKSFPQKIVLPKLRPHCSATCLNTWKAEPQKEKCPFHFRKNPPPRNQKSKRHFFFLGLPSEARRWRGVRRAYEKIFTSHGAWSVHIADVAFHFTNHKF